MRNLPVHWSEGLFLRPHHFQAADRHWAETLHTSQQWDHQYRWGLRRLELGEEAIGNYQFQVNVCHARMQDGTLVSLDAGQGPDRVDLKEAFAKLDGDFYDYILIDCPPSFGPLTLNALTVADLMVIPTQAEYYAARSLPHVFELIRLVREKTNPALLYRILVTMYDRRNSICVRVLEQMRASFSQALFETIIEVDTKLRESPVTGRPITLYKPNTRGARQYRALAEELLRYE